MIITQTPFRITLGGGGTDLPSFYRDHGGFIFAMGINKFIYLILHRLPVTERKSIIRYSQVEIVNTPNEIRHPLVREALQLHNIHEYVEISSTADLPAKTGLGSSGAYLVGLLTAIRTYKRQSITPAEVAEEACHIEMDILREPVGKQDQYMAAFGGVQTLEISKSGQVNVEHLSVDFMTMLEFVQKARVYYTGIQRSANAILKDQNEASKQKERSGHHQVVDSLLHIKEIGIEIKKSFLEKDLDRYGLLMDEHWQFKKKMSSHISLSELDDLYEKVKKEYSVLGGKIMGAGGGGFLMLYCPDKGDELDSFMTTHNMPRIDYFPSTEGSRVIHDTVGY
ncbi:MAG: galactokinase [Kiritimatiellae bacterium]|nr:galactokinase [Kiritimatiellia bacterium]